MPTPPGDAPLAITPEQIRALAELYDRFTNPIDPFDPAQQAQNLRSTARSRAFLTSRASKLFRFMPFDSKSSNAAALISKPRENSRLCNQLAERVRFRHT